MATTSGFMSVVLEGWEDDYETWNEWVVDDLLFTETIDLGAFNHLDQLALRFTDEGGWDYLVVLQVRIEYFADPDPLADGDSDGDGIKESDEYSLTKDQGGIADPTRKEVFVEVDWMTGHGLHTNSKRLVATQYLRHGISVFIVRDEQLPIDTCLTVPEARSLYLSHFNYSSYKAFRYAVISEELWNDASGVAWNDALLVDDSTWWIDGDILAQAGTLIHELGHTMSLRKTPPSGGNDPGTFRLIDTVAWFSYDSALNYTFQPTLVDYFNDGGGGSADDHNDWEDVDPSWGLRYSFGSVTSTQTGHCGS